jgi:hypothetical protein
MELAESSLEQLNHVLSSTTTMNHKNTMSNMGKDGLPSSTTTQSYWLRDLSSVLTGPGVRGDLPSTVDVVVIGSGITGAFAARKLVKNGSGSVLMLEAREACSGATGRVSLDSIRDYISKSRRLTCVNCAEWRSLPTGHMGCSP